MNTYRHDLPQARGETMLTDGGLETTLIFDDGIDLPEFASFPLLDDEAGRAALLAYFHTYADIARRHDVGVVLETPTWRASADWGAVLGYDEAALERVNGEAVRLLQEVRAAHEPATTVVISGNVGPRGDGYEVGDRMSVEEAERFHAAQVGALAGAGADLVTALTMTYAEEAIGFAKAAAGAGVPAVVSFTVETDGALPTGQPLGEAIGAVESATGGSPLAYGINCAHPDHFLGTLAAASAAGEGWVNRIGLVRANASRMSHEELDDAEELDAGDPVELGALYAELRGLLPNLVVMGGCCGTDDAHVGEIAGAALPVGA